MDYFKNYDDDEDDIIPNTATHYEELPGGHQNFAIKATSLNQVNRCSFSVRLLEESMPVCLYDKHVS